MVVITVSHFLVKRVCVALLPLRKLVGDQGGCASVSHFSYAGVREGDKAHGGTHTRMYTNVYMHAYANEVGFGN
jgi:hypothetical protein